MLEDPEFAARFDREIRSLVRLTHPHIVKLLDVGEHQGFPFAVMQYLSGGNLRDRQKTQEAGVRRVLSPWELDGWLEEVARTLDFIHSRGYLHRDVKPDNILFDDAGHAYLSDFGVAKVLAEGGKGRRQTVLTGAGMVLGTPHYMAPELILGQDYDGRVDQYALAVMAYELLSGCYPCDGPSSTAVFVQQTTQVPQRLDSLTPSLSAEAGDAVHRALAKDPTGRSVDCVSFARAVLQATSKVAPGPGRHSTTRRLVRGVQATETPGSEVACPRCGKTVKVPAEKAGKRGRCPSCREAFQAPLQPDVVTNRQRGRGDTGKASQVQFETEQTMNRPAPASTSIQAPTREEKKPRAIRATVLGGASVATVALVLVVWITFAAPAPVQEPWAREITNSIGMKFVQLEPGKFWMGSPLGEAERNKDEEQHEVELTKGCWLGVYEVTQEEYEKVMGYNPSWFQPGGKGKDMVAGLNTRRFPVEMVNCQDARTFCDRLTALKDEKNTGRKYRLPTEAEWECACRGGHRVESIEVFHLGNALSATQANFNGAFPHGLAAVAPPLNRTCQVGTYQPNTLGLHDMHGNVWEWCSDWYVPNPASQGLRDPTGPFTGSHRVARGGSWGSFGRLCRSAQRDGHAPVGRLSDLGFRVAVEPVAR